MDLSELQLIERFEVIEGHLELYTDKERLKLFCKCNSTAPWSVVLVQVQKALAEKFPDLVVNQEVLRDLLVRRSDVPRKIAEGKEPAPPVDEKLVIMAKPFRLGGRGFRYLELIEKGREVARIYPAKPGRDGYDIFGKVISASPPKTLKVDFGSGVEVQAKETYKSVVSRAKGYFYFENNVLDVKEELIIQGDVDQEIGSLRFNNRLTIKGSVGADFVVKSDGLVVVEGDVFKGSKVQSLGADLKVKGISTNAELVSKGDMEVLSLINSKVICGGLLKILKESVSSDIIAKEIKSGALIGGEIQVQVGIETKTLGAESFLPTIIKCVSPIELSREVEVLRDQLKKLTLAQSLLKLKLGPYEYKNVRDFPEEIQEKIKSFRDQLAKVEATLEQTALRLKEIQQSDENQEVVITVTEKLFPGVRLEFRDQVFEVRETISRKVRLICKLEGITQE